MDMVVTSIDPLTGGLKVSWTAPASNSYPITKYLIEIAKSDLSAWSEDALHCDGSSSTVIVNMYCIIPMSTLTNPLTYNYGFDSMVVVRASAYN